MYDWILYHNQWNSENAPRNVAWSILAWNSRFIRMAWAIPRRAPSIPHSEFELHCTQSKHWFSSYWTMEDWRLSLTKSWLLYRDGLATCRQSSIKVLPLEMCIAAWNHQIFTKNPYFGHSSLFSHRSLYTGKVFSSAWYETQQVYLQHFSC